MWFNTDMRENFVEISEIIPDVKKDIRYFSEYNFVGERIDGYNKPLAYLTKPAAYALKKASDQFKALGYEVLVYDTYRPQKAVAHFVRWAKNLDDQKMKETFYPKVNKEDLFRLGYIAENSSHSRGSTVDLTLLDKEGNPLDMGGYFDCFDVTSAADYTETLTDEQIRNRNILKETMIEAGFMPIKEEWWHFTLKDEPYPESYFDFDVE